MTTSDLPDSLTITLLDLPAIGRLAEAMVRRLPRNLVLALVGTLGAGKTTLVQAIAAAAEIDVAEVTSPTFTLLQTHRGTITLHHLDAYRVADEDEFLQLGVEELFEQPDAWTLVEWADRMVDAMPRETLWLHIDLTDQDDRRDIRLTCNDAVVMQTIADIASDLADPG